MPQTSVTHCPKCGSKFAIKPTTNDRYPSFSPTEFEGKMAECPGCHTNFQVTIDSIHGTNEFWTDRISPKTTSNTNSTNTNNALVVPYTITLPTVSTNQSSVQKPLDWKFITYTIGACVPVIWVALLLPELWPMVAFIAIFIGVVMTLCFVGFTFKKALGNETRSFPEAIKDALNLYKLNAEIKRTRRKERAAEKRHQKWLASEKYRISQMPQQEREEYLARKARMWKRIKWAAVSAMAYLAYLDYRDRVREQNKQDMTDAFDKALKSRDERHGIY